MKIIEFKLKLLNTDQFKSSDNSPYIYQMNSINIFIGGNNSGKSRFLRSLMHALPKMVNHNSRVLEEFKKIKTDLLTSLNRIKSFHPIEYETLYNEILNLNDESIFPFTFIHNFVIKYGEFTPTMSSTFASKQLFEIKNKLKTLITLEYKNKQDKQESENCLYIPILRGLKPLQEIQGVFTYNEIYSKRIKQDYKEIKNVFTGLEVFEEIKKRLLGDEQERKIIREFEDFISDNVVGEHVTLIPKYGDDILNIIVGADPQRSIVELGDGLQALICILFPIFIRKDEKYYFFIEEPELNLHPKLQKKLINLLSNPIFKLHQFFITTHSAHIIDHANTSIYNFTKENDKTLITHLDNQSKIVGALNNMGYTPSDLLQTNFIVWVEGETDKMILNHLIKKFHPSLIENYHYSIMFYGGSGDKHLLNDSNNFEFIFALNRNCAIIKDSDRTKASDDVTNKENKFKALEKLGVLTWLTPKREIENHISQEDFIQAIRLQQKNENLEIIEPTPYGDYYKVKNIHEVDQRYSPKRYIYLSEGLFKEIGIRKGNLTKSDADLIKNELQKSINETKNIIPIRDKVAVVEKLIETEYEVDNELAAFINRLGEKIKEVNNLE